MKSEHICILAVGTFFVGVTLGLIVSGEIIDSMAGVIFPGIVTLAAAFFGARYAFSLQAQKSEEELIKSQVAAANNAIFSLARMYNRLWHIKTKSLDEFRESPAAFLQTRGVPEISPDDIKIDVDSLTFLLETEHRDLLGELALEFEGYQLAVDRINYRSKYYETKVADKLEELGVVQG